MKLWILKPVDNDPLWNPWYDKTFGFVVRAETEEEARRFAQDEAGDESGYNNELPAWTSSEHSTCEELSAIGEVGVVMRDFASA